MPATGLGVTVDPAGETGSGATSAPAQAEIIQDNPASITQSTAIQTLDQLLHDNWILDTTFTVSTTMPPGTIVHLKPIHPSVWNWPNKIVSQMFNLWTGSGKIRYRPLATAWYGGSIRVGFLPPNLSEEEIRRMPIQVLTTYPNRDIDPKNTDWVDFRGPDQREVAYHYMSEFSSQKPQSFGGYIVFYVAGRLITQSPEFTTIQFITETAGDFLYDQPNPRALQAELVIDDPLGISAKVPLALHSLGDALTSGPSLSLQVLPDSIRSVPNFGFNANAVGNTEISSAPGIKITNLDLYTAERKKPQIGLVYKPTYEQATKNVTIDAPPGFRLCTSFESDSAYLGELFANHAVLANEVQIQMVEPTPGNQFRGKLDSADIPQYDFFPAAIRYIGTGKSEDPIDLSKSLPFFGMQASPVAGGESIVIFTDAMARAFAIQTNNISENLAKWPVDASKGTDSWLYNVVGPNGTPLMTIRLNPNGVFSTNASTSPIVFPATGLTFTFLGMLPVSSPLPPVTAIQRDVRYELSRAVRNSIPRDEVIKLLKDM